MRARRHKWGRFPPLAHQPPTCSPVETPQACELPRRLAPTSESVASAANASHEMPDTRMEPRHSRRGLISDEHSPIHPLKYRFGNPKCGVSAAAPARRLAAYIEYTRFVTKHSGYRSVTQLPCCADLLDGVMWLQRPCSGRRFDDTEIPLCRPRGRLFAFVLFAHFGGAPLMFLRPHFPLQDILL
jgi:hypothetical protein